MFGDHPQDYCDHSNFHLQSNGQCACGVRVISTEAGKMLLKRHLPEHARIIEKLPEGEEQFFIERAITMDVYDFAVCVYERIKTLTRLS